MKIVDFLIVGAGIVGLTIARELRQRYPTAAILVIDKEDRPGLHSSGRNSGVLHSGVYYAKGSLKAQLCSQGAREMADYHVRNGLALNRIGKVLVAVKSGDDEQLHLLAERARHNGVDAEIVDEKGLKELEPEARTATGSALWIASTTVGSPLSVMRTLANEVIGMGVELTYREQVFPDASAPRIVDTVRSGKIAYGHLINAAGLHADTVAHRFGVAVGYSLLPFKGIYWKLRPDSDLRFNHLIYPVPDLRVPFLGVHSTTTSDGATYFGPTAGLALGRENYAGLDGVSLTDMPRILGLISRQLVDDQDGFRRLAWQESGRYFKRGFLKAAQAIVPRLRLEHLLPTDKVGIRAQIVDTETGRLVNDFLVKRGQSSTHVLNAISPAWTSAFPFARFVCDNFIGRNEP